MQRLLTLALVALFVISVESTCTGVFPPYVTLPTTSFSSREMDTCCWYSENTCCGVNGQMFDLEAISSQINDIAARGISDQCYIKLSSLFCFWCDPNTSEFVTKPENPANPTSTLFLCPSFCDELFFKCFGDLDRLVNDFTEIHSATQFCEDIILDNFYEDDDDLLPNFRIKVMSEDASNCWLGIDDDEVEAEGDICLPLPSSGLVSNSHIFDPIVFASSVGAASTLLTCLWMIIFSIVVMM